MFVYTFQAATILEGRCGVGISLMVGLVLNAALKLHAMALERVFMIGFRRAYPRCFLGNALVPALQVPCLLVKLRHNISDWSPLIKSK